MKFSSSEVYRQALLDKPWPQFGAETPPPRPPQREHYASHFAVSDNVREEKEAFVSGLEGGSLLQCLVPVLLVPAALLLMANLCTYLQLRKNSAGKNLPTKASNPNKTPTTSQVEPGATIPPTDPCPWALDAIVLGIPVLVVFTRPASSLAALGFLIGKLLASAALFILSLELRSPDHVNRWREEKALVLVEEPRKPFVTAFKGAAMFLTCFAILAVDFPCFDRAYAKTESFGISLMDLGVGLFVFSSGITSKWARGAVFGRGHHIGRGGGGGLAARRKKRRGRGEHRDSDESDADSGDDDEDEEEESGGEGGIFVMILSPINLPALLLGVGRLVVIRTVNYQEHSSEYGVHWNFYLTLVGVWYLAACGRRCVNFVFLYALPAVRDAMIGADEDESHDRNDDNYDGDGSVWVVGVAAAAVIAYQVILQSTGLGEWVLTAPRLFTPPLPSSGDTMDPLTNKHDEFGGFVPWALLSAVALRARTFFQANREGLLALLPFTFLFVCAEQLGRLALWPTRHVTQQRHKVGAAWAVRAAALFAAALGCWLIFGASAALVQRPSRRLANLPFVLLSLATGTTLLAAFLVVDLVASGGTPLPSQCSRILVGMGQWPLLTFIIANLLTGLVNLFVDTLRTPPATARLVLVVYMAIVAAVPWCANASFGNTRYGASSAQKHPRKES